MDEHTIAQWLDRLEKMEVTFEVSGEILTIKTPTGQVAPRLRRLILRNQPKIKAVVKARQELAGQSKVNYVKWLVDNGKLRPGED